ncbi:MAG: hypothetical protein FJX76_20440 [Armatimonadetes bacterium]|nr:hypothetical protein [Armatimonadota bacterium]
MSDTIAHGHHGSSPIGGTLDGSAVGLGLGMISLIFAYNAPWTLKYCLIWLPISLITGVVLGTVWGKSRGY